MHGLERWYLDSLIGYADAIEGAVQSFEESPEEVDRSLRRMAHSIRGSAGSYGFPALGELAAATEDAKGDALVEHSRTLAETLRGVAQGSPNTELRVLVLEDDPIARRIARDALSGPGRSVTLAGTTSEFRHQLETGPADLIVLDLVLPDDDGRALLMELRERAATRATPIVVVSRLSDESTQSECYALGADAFFGKPIQGKLLSAAVSGLLARSGRARQASRQDVLTGLPNRAAFDQAFRRAVAHARRTGTHLAIGMLDVDRFKRINDRFGHVAGDRVLRAVADAISTRLRGSDMMARWGGEEFVALLSDTDAQGAAIALGKCLDAVRNLDFELNGQRLEVTASAGVADVDVRATLAQAVERADQRLYEAKLAGRDRVVREGDSVALAAETPVALLIEDDTAVGGAVKSCLAAAGIHVVTLTNGATARRELSNASYDVVILDIEIPGVGGLELLRWIRDEGLRRETPVLVLTSHDSDDMVTRAFDLGADDYVVKPFSARALAARVRRLLPKSKGS